MSDAMIQPVIEENDVEYGISIILVSREPPSNPVASTAISNDDTRGEIPYICNLGNTLNTGREDNCWVLRDVKSSATVARRDADPRN